MSVTISNVRAALCSVDVSGFFASPIATKPKFKGPGAREFANAGFGPFAPLASALDTNSVRLAAGIYRMHVTQPFTFSGGEAAPLATCNATAAQLSFYGPQELPQINAEGTDFGDLTAVGCDVLVTIGTTNLVDPAYDPMDVDFTLWVFQYPQQNTQ